MADPTENTAGLPLTPEQLKAQSDFMATLTTQVQADRLKSDQGIAAQKNAWLLSTKPVPATFPVPSWRVVVGADGWSVFVQDGPALWLADSTPATPADPQAGNIEISWPSKQMWGAEVWYAAGRNDRFPVGQTTPPIPDPSGVYHKFEKFGGMGTGHYLQLVAPITPPPIFP